jgi:hypothetical protein
MPTRGIEVRPEHYYQAGIDRITEAKRLRDDGRGNTALAAYLCGLSTECALRALVPIEAEFYDRHDLLKLAEVGAWTAGDEKAVAPLGKLLTESVALWRNSLRFYSQDLFEAYCRKRARALKLSVPRKTSPVTTVCARLYHVSTLAFTECVVLWQK